MAASFQRVQADFAAHIRDPQGHAPPPDVEARRMAIYVRLFHGNIDAALSAACPKLRRILGKARWQALVRDFVRVHRAETPYYARIPEEFLQYLSTRCPTRSEDAQLPPFALELCHYEWLRKALALAPDADCAFDDEPLAIDEPLSLSPLAWPLRYDYPVIRIDADYQPQEPPETPTCLIACRDRHDAVRFLASNAVTLRLLALIGEGAPARQCLHALARELDAPAQRIERTGMAILDRLHGHDVVVRRRQGAAAAQQASEAQESEVQESEAKVEEK